MKFIPQIKKFILNNWKSIFSVIAGIFSWYWGVVKYSNEKASADACIELNEKLYSELQEKDLIISDIMVKVSIDTYDIEDVPFPMGYKVFEPLTQTFRMVRVNKAYKDRYGVSNTRYFGKQDVVFDEKNAPLWYKNDLKVIEGEPMKTFRFYEQSIIGIGSWRKWKVVKGKDKYLYFIEI